MQQRIDYRQVAEYGMMPGLEAYVRGWKEAV
jgi:hypothetical protein